MTRPIKTFDRKQINFAASEEERKMLMALTLFLSNKYETILTLSNVMRAAVHLANKYKDELELKD